MAKNKITTGEGFVTFEWGDGSRTISVNPNFVYVSLFEDTLSFTLVGVPRPTGLSLFTTRYDDFELNGATFGSADEALEAILEAFEAAGASFRWIIVDELPATGQSNVMYLLRIPNPEGGNLFEEYIWVENDWELVGSNGGSSIRTIYVGTSADSVDSGTCIINKVEGKKDWLNIVYADSDGYCNMTKINLNEFIIEGEFASGVTSLDDGTVVGVVDPRQSFVHTEYDESGNPISSGDVKVLSVGESGFTVDRIQDAINAKVLIDRRLYTPKEGEYNKANQEITFKSDLNDELFIVDLSGDTELNSGSTNYVENSAITKAFEDVQDNIISSTTYVASSHTIEYNNRKDVKLFETVLDVDNDLDSGSTNPVVNSAVTEAINDLDERKADWVSAVTSGDVSASTSAYTLNYTNRSGDTLFSIELPKEEGKLYKAGRAIKIESGDTADTISFGLPIYSGSGENAVVIGNSKNNENTASGRCSIAAGRRTEASGTESVAIGIETKAKGALSFAMGSYSQTNGMTSAALGEHITTHNSGEVGVGSYNISKSGNTASAQTQFTVGNGYTVDSVQRHHNSLEIMKDGSIYIADINATGETYQKPMILLQDALGGDSVRGDEVTIHSEINADEEKVISSLVYVNKITTGLPETVKERYQLVGADGNPYTTASGDTSANIDIYKDSHIVSITYITDSGDTHYQNLEYKYIDASGDTQTEYVDISELVLEVEIGDGLEVQNHIVKGKIDPASEKVVTEYTTAGTSAQTEEVLTVGENGFKASNIQLAIDTKAEVNHKLYDVVNGVYEASSHTISFVSENDDLFDTELTFDNALNSGSTNAVQNKVVKEEIEKRQIKNVELTQAEYDALVSAGTVDEETLYIISDAEPIDTSKYVTSASITSNTSAYTISFSGESGELFDIEFNKGGGSANISAGTNIHIEEGEEFDTISVSGASAITSSSTEVVQSKVIYEELDKKLDKVNFINNLYPKGSVYITYEYKNPSTFIGGEWELIGGEDADKNYYPAFAIATDSAGTTINESLPNITGKFTAYDYAGGWHEGATSTRQTLNPSANAGGSETPWIGYTFNASTSNSTYQDGAQVNVNAIKLFHWRRTDDGTIVEQITPLDVDVEDVLWEGSQGAATNVTITLSQSIGDYKYLKFYSRKDENNMVDNVDVKDINVTTSSLEIIKEHGWDSALRYFRFHKTSDTTFEMDLVDLTLYKITGVRAVPTSDATAEVTDVLWQGTSSTGASTITLSNNFEGYNKLKLTFADTWIQIRYIETKDIKPSILFDLDWSNDSSKFCFLQPSQPTSGNKLLINTSAGVKLTKVEGIKRYSAIDITAGDGINISEGGVISSTVTFKNYYVNINMTTQGNFNGTITCDSGFVPLGLGSTSIRTDGAVGYGYCDNIVKLSDTQYRFSGWANPNGTSGSGASSITIYATFVKNASVLNNY